MIRVRGRIVFVDRPRGHMAATVLRKHFTYNTSSCPGNLAVGGGGAHFISEGAEAETDLVISFRSPFTLILFL